MSSEVSCTARTERGRGGEQEGKRAIGGPSPHTWSAAHMQGPPDPGPGVGLRVGDGRQDKAFCQDLDSSTWVGKAKRVGARSGAGG